VAQLKALGGLKLEGTAFTRPTPLLLLTYLSLEGSQQRRHVAELFWQGGNHMKSLSMTLTRLRQGAGDVVEADEKRTWTRLQSDAKELLESLDQSHWQQASDLYTGAFLEGVVLDDWSSELEDWVYTTREYLAERVQYALLNLAEEAAKKQDFDNARDLAERAYKLPGLAGTEVTSLKRLYPLLCAGCSLLAPEVRKNIEEYGLKLELTTEKARATFEQVLATPNTLPVRGTSFIGRDEELTELATLLNKPKVALLTLLGHAGVGKTRLALQLAHEQQKLGGFKDGVYFVPLDALGDASLLTSSLLSHFGLTQQGKAEPLDQLTNFIASKNILLVLDNFEHLLDGSSLLSTLLNTCQNLKILVTSRERLHLEEEHLFPLEGLAFPTVDVSFEEARTFDAVTLFRERAQQLQPQFELQEQLDAILRICKLVEGLPLGLELAASWVRLMSCTEIADEIQRNLEFLTTTTRNVPERHRSLKAAFEYSWKLLTPKEQEVLRKLSVFVGGFRREAASTFTGATIPLLASLVDKSLLRVLPNGRYDRHPLLYQFTQEKLAEQPSEQFKNREHHACYYVAFAEHADTHLQGNEQVTWFGRLDEELDNLREALGYLETKDDLSTALRLATALGYFWNTRGYYAEGCSHLTTLLSKTSGTTFTRAKASLRAGDLLWKQGNHVSAQTLYEQSLATAKTLGERSLQAKALTGLGIIAELNRSDFEGARSHYQSALELAGESGDKACLADALCQLGALSSEEGNYHYAQTCYETSANLYDELGNQQGRAKLLTNLATVLTYLGEFYKAHALNVESLELLRSVGDRHGMGIALLNLGVDASETQEKIKYYQESLQLFRDLGDKRMVSHLLNNLGGNFQKLAELDKAQTLLEESLAIQQQVGDVALIAHALYILGQILRDKGAFQQAHQTYNTCIDLCRKNDDNWTLMRVLEVFAKLHLHEQDYQSAKVALEEALLLAQKAGDKKTLEKILETQARLSEAVDERLQVSAH
jgi:predicted ATPase/uncharacterized protein HemY